MYEDNDFLPLEATAETSIWRYLDFPRFISLLHSESLFFASAATLREQDKWEAAYPHKFIDASVERFASTILKDYRHKPQTMDGIRIFVRDCWANPDGLVFVNCWHINETESDAMWKLYAGLGQSIAIRSTVVRLAESFNAYPDLVVCGTIQYIDYETDSPLFVNVLHPFFCKRKSFAHERELRAAIVRKNREPDERRGILINVDIPTLIESVYVAPQSPDWFVEVVKSVLDKYGFGSVAVQSSRLDIVPLAGDVDAA
jgi:hypothetical protein